MRYIALVLSILILCLSCTSTEAFVSPSFSAQDVSVEEKLLSVGGVPVSVPNPEIFFDGALWLERFTELVEEADDYILITTFLGSDCPELDDLYHALMEAAERGVRVYFIMDGLSSFDMTESKNYMTPLYFLRRGGVHLTEYNPVTVTHLLNPATIIIRDHRKMLVVDGSVAAVGGMNMNYISMGAGEGKTQRDSMYLFNSPSLASALTDEFVTIWNGASMEKIKRSDFASCSSDAETTNAFLIPSDSVPGMYASLIGSAEESVLLFPYLPALDSKMKECVRSAIDKGISVDMVMPVDLRGYAASGIYHGLPDLLRDTGTSVYLTIYGEKGEVLPLLHEKLMIVDSRYVVIGSANFNYRSMTLSKELALVIDSPSLASKLEEHAKKIAEYAVPVTVEEADRLKKEEGNILAYLFTFFGG